MKKLLMLSVALCFTVVSFAQTINAAYVTALYARYPIAKSDFCSDCYIWVNPYFKSIADIKRHMPLITYEFYTKINNDSVAIKKIPRTGIYAAWHSVTGQPNETAAYKAANAAAKRANPNDMIAKGHCEPWILNAFSYDSAILSDTYTFNAACEDQKQNVGTEIATENITRELLKTTDVQVWCGTFGSQGTFTDGHLTLTYPAFYWKIIKANGTTTCYWMPNKITETKAKLPLRIVTFETLVHNLGFDPEQVIAN